ncbi:MAG: IS110 family transposase [Nitrosopumilus sp. D6]|nr:MAG: IS110 family transposase [Nitrosopumilus sp. D6]
MAGKKRPVSKQILAKAGQLHVGIDLHKKFLQVAVMNQNGTMLFEDRIDNDWDVIKKFFARFPQDSRYVVESSSVWYGLYRYMTDKLGMDVTVSNPFVNKVIATSKKKTDKVDARILADLDRGGYISECYVPDEQTVENRRLTRFRHKMVHMRTACKNGIHGILLQDGIKIHATNWTAMYMIALHRLKNYRIEGYLTEIESFNKIIHDLDYKIRAITSASEEACRLKTIPGVGDYTALVMTAEIGDKSRFLNSHQLCAYAGIVPSVRNSADTIHHGNITKRGSKMMRWALVEAVHTHVRRFPETDLSIFYKRLEKKRGRSKATVAAASKLLRIMYWMLKEGKDFAPNYSQSHKPREDVEGKPR